MKMKKPSRQVGLFYFHQSSRPKGISDSDCGVHKISMTLILGREGGPEGTEPQEVASPNPVGNAPSDFRAQRERSQKKGDAERRAMQPNFQMEVNGIFISNPTLGLYSAPSGSLQKIFFFFIFQSLKDKST